MDCSLYLRDCAILALPYTENPDKFRSFFAILAHFLWPTLLSSALKHRAFWTFSATPQSLRLKFNILMVSLWHVYGIFVNSMSVSTWMQFIYHTFWCFSWFYLYLISMRSNHGAWSILGSITLNNICQNFWSLFNRTPITGVLHTHFYGGCLVRHRVWDTLLICRLKLWNKKHTHIKNGFVT